jgi:Uma2 family endonuclease
MSVTTQAPGSFPVPPFPVRLFSVAEYHRMIETGILTEDDAVELLEGWIAPKMPRNPPHDAILDQAQEVIRALLPDGWRVRVQSAITTADSEPEPDIAVVPGPASRYRSQHPQPADIVLVVEVADSTLGLDRTIKAKIYARAGIASYWIINIPANQIEAYADPTGPDPNPRYRSRHDFILQDTITLNLPGFPPIMVSVADLLG